eukprot:s176_g27.t2
MACAEVSALGSPGAWPVSAGVAVRAASGLGGQWAAAGVTLQTLRRRDLEGSVVSFGAAISAAEKGQAWEQAYALHDQLLREGLRTSTVAVNAAISAGKTADWRGAVAFLEQLSAGRLEPTVVTYAAAISCCEKSRQWQMALRLFSQISDTEIQPNIIACNAAISACEKAGQWTWALELQEHAERCTLNPNIVTCAASTSACEKAAEWEPAVSLLRAARRRLLQLNVIACNAFLGACQNAWQWQRSLAALSAMADNCDVVSVTAAVTACGDASAWQHATDLMADVDARHLQPDFSLLSAAMSAFAEGASTSTSGGWLRALEIQGALILVRLRPGLASFNSVLRACQRDSAWRGGVAALSEMARHQISPDEVGCAATLRGCRSAGAWAPLRRLLDDISAGLLREAAQKGAVVVIVASGSAHDMTTPSHVTAIGVSHVQQSPPWRMATVEQRLSRALHAREYLKQLFETCRGIAEVFDIAEPLSVAPKILRRPTCETRPVPAPPRSAPPRSARQRQAARSAHLKLFKGMPRPPALPRAVVSRNCRPQPSPFGASVVQQPPWNCRAGSGRRQAPPSPEAMQAADAAMASAAARAAVWRPWTPTLPKQIQIPVLNVEAPAAEALPPRSSSTFQARNSSSLQVRPLSGSRSLRSSPSQQSNALTSDMAKSLKSTFDSKVFGNTLRLDETRGEGSIPRWKLHKLAREMNMTVESIIVAKEIFDEHDFDGSGMLSLDEIAKVIETLMEFQIADKDCVNYRIESGQTNRLLNYWLKFAPEGVFELDFESFLIWYSCTGFLTELMIDDREIRLRLLAKANNLDALCMDRVRKSFNSIDVDGSGEVDIHEFESILREVLKVPAHLDMPESRIRYFWNEIDVDGSGKAGFDEFLSFWLSQFGSATSGQKGQTLSLEDFYKSQRRIGAKYLDPHWNAVDKLTSSVSEFIDSL